MVVLHRHGLRQPTGLDHASGPRIDVTADGHLAFTPRASRLRGTPLLGRFVAMRDRVDERRAVERCDCASCRLDR